MTQTTVRGDSNDSPRFVCRLDYTYEYVTQTLDRGDSNEVRGDSNDSATVCLIVGWIRLMYKGLNQTLDRGDSNDSPR